MAPVPIAELPSLAAPAPDALSPPPQPRARWGSLDALRGLALLFMVAHHLAKWTGGRVEERFVGFDGLVLTDLAAPMFTVAVGAAAHLVGRQVRRRPARAGRAAYRWGQVLALGLAIDIAVGGGVDGGGVLATLAVLGVAVTAVTAVGLTHPVPWWALAGVAAAGSVPAMGGSSGGYLGQLWSGSFSVVVYGVFAAAGAALAAHGAEVGERALPLGRAAVGAVVAGVVGAAALPGLLAPDGIWPPHRHPGDLAFTAWGLAGTLVLWAAIRAVLPATSRLGAGLVRAGQRTLLVFGAHYLIKIALQHTGLLETLDTWRWGLVAWAAAAVIAACSMAPKPRPRPATPASPAGPGPDAAPAPAAVG